MKLENKYTRIHTSISICAFPLFHTKVKIRNNKMSKQEDQLTLATTILEYQYFVHNTGNGIKIPVLYQYCDLVIRYSIVLYEINMSLQYI